MSLMRSAARGLSAVCLLAFTFLPLTMAQERTGTIGGTVTDPSGSAIQGALVEVAGTALQHAATASTNSAGAYLFSALPSGTYSITVSAPGFAKRKVENINLVVGKTLVSDIRLEVGQVSENIVVSESSVVIDTATATVATNVTGDVYDRLPKGRSFDSLIFMAPGTRPEPKSGQYQIDGASGSENSYIIDGLAVGNIQNGVLDRQSRVPIEWIADTQVKSSGFDAQFGGAVGGVVNASTKMGGNSFHGQVSLYLNSDGLDGSPQDVAYQSLRLLPTNDDKIEYFQNKKDSYRILQPGFILTGRIIRDKLWFTASAYPSFTKTDRTVSFTNGFTSPYTSKVRQDYTLTRLDYAPISKLRMNVAYQYNPTRTNGLLPTRQGTDAIGNPWADRGSRNPFSQFTYQADYIATQRLVLSVFGGTTYANRKDYGVPAGTYINYATPTSRLGALEAQVPAQFRAPSGDRTPNSRRTLQDIYTRFNNYISGSYLLNAAGQHNLKFGYDINRLANRPIADAWNEGYLRFYWGAAYSAITKAGQYRGAYGYYRARYFATFGDVSSNNQGLFLQDNWRVNRKLTLSLGLRTEREFLPSFAIGNNVASNPITFGFGSKLSPRLGFAWDPSGVGKQKIYGSFGLVYDLMKYELPRGSFGGDLYKDYYYTLDTGDISQIKYAPTASNNGAGTLPGTFIESLDRRIPSNATTNNLIDPNLKPVKSRNMDFGYDYSFSSTWVAGVRWADKRLVRTIEDVGILTPIGEQYYITNPGFGLSIDPKGFPAGYPNPANPKAKRDYDAVEFRLERRFAKNFFFNASYTWSRLYGNYGGLASSDEDGRTSPNVNRYFDEAWMNYDSKGKLVNGLLATDRPHTFKFFGNYDLKSKLGVTRFSPLFFAYSGTPVTTEYAVQDVPVFINGRGDLGRTPVLSQTNLLVSHDFKLPKEGHKIRFEANFNNLFNQQKALDRYKTQSHANDGSINFDNTADIFKGYNVTQLAKDQEIRNDPRYNQASSFQIGRSIRFGFHYIF